jgi:hypothetical protein
VAHLDTDSRNFRFRISDFNFEKINGCFKSEI